MTSGLRPYPEYKDSDLLWLGRIPAYWDIRRNGRLFAQRNETGYGNLPILEVSLKTGVRVRDMNDRKRKQVMSDREKYKRAAKGDIAYNMMRMWQGAVGVAPEDGLVSPAYVVARPYPEAEPRFFSYLFRTDAYKGEVDGFSRGIVKDRNRLYWEDFKRMPSCVPPLDEQKAIADYLDRNATHVRRFIRNRRRLIEVLNEQKQAIINRAVTRGLDPKVTLKPSDIDWLGDVPAHWEVRRLKTVATVIMGQSPPSSECNGDGEGLPFLQGSAEFGVYHPRAIQYCPTASKIAPEGAILFSVRAPVGALNVADQKYGIGRGLCAIVPNATALEQGYAIHAISAGKLQLLMIATGSTYDAVSAGEVGAMQIPLPPIVEQQAVGQRIVDATSNLAAAIDHAQREIDLIREYRTRLIVEVVTGKVDVRVAASAAQPKRRANLHFCRSVLAAEIVERHRDTRKFGAVKLQKAVILAERHLRLGEIQSKPQRAAAGPFDNAMMRSIHAQLKRQKWFDPVKTPKGMHYEPMENRGGHRPYFDRYWGAKRAEFDRLIGLIKPMTTEQAEIVATLYMAWNDFLIGGESVDDDKLVAEVLNNWDRSKQRIGEPRWRKAVAWMREKGLVPHGFGSVTTEFNGK